MNCALTACEDNVDICTCAGRIYFMTTRDIHPGQELMYFYGEEFVQSMGATYWSYVTCNGKYGRYYRQP